MENIRLDSLQVEPGVYIPPVGRDYPTDDPYVRLLHPVHDREIPIDETYPYLDDSWHFRINNWFGHHIVLHGMVYTINSIRFGLRVEGRENLRAYQSELRNGAITISNHCYAWDAACILKAVGGKETVRIPMLADSFQTKDYWFLRYVGGVPIPENSMAAMKKYKEAFDTYHERGSWFHVFPEARRWDFYKPIRPFMKGAFTMSYQYAMPIVPCAITFRPRTGIYRLFGKKELPLLTVRIGKPIFPDLTQPRKDEVNRLLHLTHQSVCQLAGITHNTWPEQL